MSAKGKVKSGKSTKGMVKSSKKKKKDKYWGSSAKTFSPSKRSPRECVLYNMSTKVAMKCQYNPEDLPRTRSVNYATITSPGMAYPLIQFVSGEVEDVDINLFFHGRDKESLKRIANFEKFVNTLLPPKHNKKSFKKPPVFKFYYGNTVENYVLTKKAISEELMDKEGNVYSIKYTLSARRV